MCGLAMVINKYKNGFSKPQQDVFSTLLYLSGGFRGRDGAGVAVIDNIGNVKMAKDGTAVDPFIQSKEYEELDNLAWSKGWAMMGHNRAATRGVVSDKNSHPFVVDDKIVLVHNGTFNGDHKKVKDTEVDSEAIAHTLAETENVEEALRKINAAYALMWYNVDNKEINVIRNAQRPLWWFETDSMYAFASEDVFLHFVIQKFGLKVTEQPTELKAETLCTFTLGKDKGTTESIKSLDVSYYKHNSYKADVSVSVPPFGGVGHFGEAMNEYYEQEARLVLPYNPPEHSPKIVLNTQHYKQSEKIYSCIGAQARKTFQGECIALRNEYVNARHFRVLVNDMIEADDDPNTKNFIMMGRTMDRHQMHCAFLLCGQTLEDIIDLQDKAVFEVQFENLLWKRIDHVFPIDVKKPTDEWPGLCVIHASHPNPVFMHQSNEHAC